MDRKNFIELLNKASYNIKNNYTEVQAIKFFNLVKQYDILFPNENLTNKLETKFDFIAFKLYNANYDLSNNVLVQGVK